MERASPDWKVINSGIKYLDNFDRRLEIQDLDPKLFTVKNSPADRKLVAMGKIQAETGFSLKDELFNQEKVRILTASLKRVYAPFNTGQMERKARQAFPGLELKQRIHWLVDKLDIYLPGGFNENLDILYSALPPALNPDLRDDDFGQFIWVVPGMYVARYGCESTRLERSFVFLREATKRFSSEFAVRPFLLQFPEETYRFLLNCTQDSHYHVRRWASEGTRPYLPWAERVVLPSKDIVQLLDQLHGDPSRFVTRSVANSLNDISKMEPQLVVKTLKRWFRADIQDKQELRWMSKHALRTLLKKGDKTALALLGYSASPKYRLMAVDVTEQVEVGGALVWYSRIFSKASQRLTIGLRLYYLRSNGTYSTKIYVVKDATFSAGEQLEFTKRVPIRPMTTRVLYPGTHYVELVVNGQAQANRAFELVA